MNSVERANSRRRFLAYLAASPVLTLSAKRALAEEAEEGPVQIQGVRPEDPFVWWPRDPNYVVEKPEDALDVFELEAAAHKTMPPAHFGFVTSGADDEGSQKANRQDIAKFAIRGRRLRDVRQVDISRELFGQKHSMPFFFCPIGFERAIHTDGVAGAARAAGRHNVAQMLSTYASSTVGDAITARGGSPVMFQLYIQQNWDMTQALVQNAEKQGAHVVAVTVDDSSLRKDTQFERSKRHDTRLCFTCHKIDDPKHPKNPNAEIMKVPNFRDMPADITKSTDKPAKNWELIKRIRDITKMEIFLKGIMNPEDAALCVRYGYGIHVSNHGGRNEDTNASTISALPDILAVAKGKVPVFIDGGFRRGMDIVKAIAMGATMVGFGRPWAWGLGAFGEAGVDRVIQIMQAELIAAMQQVGAASLKDLTPNLVYRSL